MRRWRAAITLCILSREPLARPTNCCHTQIPHTLPQPELTLAPRHKAAFVKSSDAGSAALPTARADFTFGSW